MQIQDIVFFPLSVQLPEGKAYGMAKALATARQSTLVRLRLADGTEGVGEAWGIPTVNLAYLPLFRGYLDGERARCRAVFSRILARHYHFGTQGPLIAASRASTWPRRMRPESCSACRCTG